MIWGTIQSCLRMIVLGVHLHVWKKPRWKAVWRQSPKVVRRENPGWFIATIQEKKINNNNICDCLCKQQVCKKKQIQINSVRSTHFRSHGNLSDTLLYQRTIRGLSERLSEGPTSDSIFPRIKRNSIKWSEYRFRKMWYLQNHSQVNISRLTGTLSIVLFQLTFRTTKYSMLFVQLPQALSEILT